MDRGKRTRRKKKKSPFEWPFSFYRQTWIAEADDLKNKAIEIIAEHPTPNLNQRADRAVRRAAKALAKAADKYRHAGLGLAAKSCWEFSSDCFAAVGDTVDAENCDNLASGIETEEEIT
jgi:hypothetical protein